MTSGAKQAVCAALVRGTQIMLGKRIASKTLDPLKWSLFGGHIRPNESPEDAIRRELCEELGVEVAAAHHLGQLREMDAHNRYMTQVYIVTTWRGEPVNLEEHEEIRWVELAAMRELDLSPGLVAIIEEMGLVEAIARLTA